MSKKPIDSEALDTLFLNARSYNAWQEKEVSDDLLHKIHDIAKMGPTAANCCPMRIVFVKSKEAKEKLKPCLDKGNVDKTMAAPVTALFASDLNFYQHMPKLFPHADAKSWYEGRDAYILETAQRNGTLQGAYVMLAARALGLDCGPMSGFNKDKVRDAFFAGENVDVNFICNIGYGSTENLYPRLPRFDFADVNKIV